MCFTFIVQPSFDISQLCFDSRGGVQNAPCTFTAMFIGTGLARLLCFSVSTIVHADYTATPYKNVQYNADYTARRLSEARVKKRSQTPQRSQTPKGVRHQKESDTKRSQTPPIYGEPSCFQGVRHHHRRTIKVPPLPPSPPLSP